MATSNTRVNPIERVVALNNQAVLLLATPDGHCSAISQLREALEGLKSCSSMMVPLHGTKMDFVETHDSLPSLDDCMRSGEQGYSFASRDQAFYIYRKAIVIPKELSTMAHGTSLLRHHSIISSIVLFNLALAFHVSAMGATSQCDVSANLKRALKLYELAFSLHCSIVETDGGYGSTLFLLAVTNNVGLIHNCLNNEAAAHQCFEMVLSTLMHLSDQQQGSSSWLSGFFQNVQHLMSKFDAAPAA